LLSGLQERRNAGDPAAARCLGWSRGRVFAPWLTMAILLLTGCAGTPQVAGPPQTAPPTSAPPTAQQNGSVSISPQYAAAGPGEVVHFSAVSSSGGAITWSVNQIAGGNASVGRIDANGNYTAPTLRLSANVVITAALSASPTANYATAVVADIMPGQVTRTINPQVAIYSIYLPAPGNAAIQFGPNASETVSTWSQPTPSPYGGMIHVFVAGMLANTDYQMQALVKLDDGVTFQDQEHTFATGAPQRSAAVQTATTSGFTPQPGIELFDTLIPNEPAQAFATDLQGRVLWTYTYQGSYLDAVQGVKLLPDGNFLVMISFASSVPNNIAANPPSGTIDAVREVDLAGDTIRQLTMDQLNQSLAAEGYNLQLRGFHHDVLPLPNGDIVLLADMIKPMVVAGYAGTTDVLGDVLVDVDKNFKPIWVWNTFDHMDVNRHPFGFPDWTHGNALLYSADDQNLLFSMRQQNWIIKIDFQDGNGSGNILWRLGPGGDFKLVGGVDPTDWFYGQHGPNFFTPNTTGVFQLGIMDNGNDRQFPPGVTCGSAGAPPCLYSSAVVMQVDETAMTATIVSRYTPPASLYSFFGGNVTLLPDSHILTDFCASKGGSVIRELDESGGTPQVVWQALTPNADQYRTRRLPSLYPGVEWTSVP
jgi:arylsulfate sulfotransferase